MDLLTSSILNNNNNNDDDDTENSAEIVTDSRLEKRILSRYFMNVIKVHLHQPSIVCEHCLQTFAKEARLV